MAALSTERMLVLQPGQSTSIRQGWPRRTALTLQQELTQPNIPGTPEGEHGLTQKGSQKTPIGKAGLP